MSGWHPDPAEDPNDTVKVGARIPRSLNERVRNAVHGMPRSAVASLNEAFTQALAAWVELMELEHNERRPFPPIDAPLRGGGGRR